MRPGSVDVHRAVAEACPDEAAGCLTTIGTATDPYVPCPIPLPPETPTPDPHLTPPRREGHPLTLALDLPFTPQHTEDRACTYNQRTRQELLGRTDLACRFGT